jgi:hypothetical protein
MTDAFLNSRAQVRGDSRADRSPRLTAFLQLNTVQDRLIAAITSISARPGSELGSWTIAQNGVVFTGAASVAVTRYRYRGSTIATPWTPNPATATSS